MIFIFFRKWRRRLVRIVWIVQMHPNEMRSGAMLFKPSFGVIDDFHAATLHASPVFFFLCVGLLGAGILCAEILSVAIRTIGLRKIIVIVEAAIESRRERVAIEYDSSNKSRGLIPLPLQQLCSSDMLR